MAKMQNISENEINHAEKLQKNQYMNKMRLLDLEELRTLIN